MFTFTSDPSHDVNVLSAKLKMEAAKHFAPVRIIQWDSSLPNLKIHVYKRFLHVLSPSLLYSPSQKDPSSNNYKQKRNSLLQTSFKA